MDGMARKSARAATWSCFARIFVVTFAGGLAGVYAFVLLVDPYDVVPFSLPIERRIVSITQRHMYPQIVRSRAFDALIIGTSTSRLIDPKRLDRAFGARFANLAMNSMTAWEQKRFVEFFTATVGPPKALVVGLDTVWCTPDASRRTTLPGIGFPEWLYDDVAWNDYPHLLNSATVEIAGRLVGYNLGLYPERVRYDGYEMFVPPDAVYDEGKARDAIWGARTPAILPDLPPPHLDDDERNALTFGALPWLDAMLADMPTSTAKVLAWMPVHVAAQPIGGTRKAAEEAECKARIAAIGHARGAILVDWRITSPITVTDANYWDSLHYRVSIAERIAQGLIDAVREGREPQDRTYRLVVR
jgi:hypothetical protein